MRALALTLVVLGLGCGATAEAPPPGEPPVCALGEYLRDDGSCVPAGLPPDMRCPPSEWWGGDGCIPAGVPPDGCGEGFVHDGDRGCEPVLPAEPCPPGLMAVPGETACREIMPCAPGTWGDIPVEPDTEYVDASYAGTDSDGSALKPWTSIPPAVEAASPGAIVAIASGSYPGEVLVTGKSLRLWGVCPRLVEVLGAGNLAAIVVGAGADGSEVRNVALSGDDFGFVLSGSLDVVLEHVWVHENARFGMSVENTAGPTSLILRDALIEQNHEVGMYLLGSEATLETSVIRTTQPDAQGFAGRSVNAEASLLGLPSTLVLERSLVEQSREFGFFVAGSDVTIESSVVRATQPNAQGVSGRGINVQSHSAGVSSKLFLGRSLVEQSHEFGVFIEGSETTIQASVVRSTQPGTGGYKGIGVSVQAHSANGSPSRLDLEVSLVEQNHEIGVFVEASMAILGASVVRTTQITDQGLFGRGVNAQLHPTTGEPAVLSLDHSLVEQNHDLGVFIGGSEASIVASIIRATQLTPDGHAGRGVNIQAHPTIGAGSTVHMQRSLIEQSHEAGVFVVGSDVTIASSEVRDTLPDAQGLFGEGIGVASEYGPASVTITATRIDQSARAALAAWGAHAAIADSVLRCQAFDLDAEAFQGTPATLEDLGGNVCGCPEANAPCKAVSANLAPPPSPNP